MGPLYGRHLDSHNLRSRSPRPCQRFSGPTLALPERNSNARARFSRPRRKIDRATAHSLHHRPRRPPGPRLLNSYEFQVSGCALAGDAIRSFLAFLIVVTINFRAKGLQAVLYGTFVSA